MESLVYQVGGKGPVPGDNHFANEGSVLPDRTSLALSVGTDPEGLHHLDQAGAIASAGRADHIFAATLKIPEDDPDTYRWRRLLKPVRRAGPAEQSCREARRQRVDSLQWSRR
ncbi:hypothetical protein H8B02_12975 [Bradyrhizobium sp. Pear77]|uniref:hypothetical protein n=1 Tax=Bradyrhizobium altum TaxID=1571202 RepID=UPI001E4F4B9A|nr:hypothetical protein [Bradyrhizobium altum]MCC8954331.1 hypothetical protein [Bradyrhizobium altum]